jgi:hypothetical protein
LLKPAQRYSSVSGKLGDDVLKIKKFTHQKFSVSSAVAVRGEPRKQRSSVEKRE